MTHKGSRGDFQKWKRRDPAKRQMRRDRKRARERNHNPDNWKGSYDDA